MQTQPRHSQIHVSNRKARSRQRQRRFLLVVLGIVLVYAAQWGWVRSRSLLPPAPLSPHRSLPSHISPPPGNAAAGQTPDWSRASFPVPQFERYSSLWGWRTDPFSGQRRMHRGLDIAGPTGSPIVAWWSGTVTTVANQPVGCGKYILIRSGEWEHLYCHNQTVLVSEGETVLAGQAIATLGSTGKSSGPHCHFELWFAGENLDPALVFQAMYQAQKQQDSASIETPVSYRVPDTQTLQVSGSDRDVADHALD